MVVAQVLTFWGTMRLLVVTVLNVLAAWLQSWGCMVGGCQNERLIKPCGSLWAGHDAVIIRISVRTRRVINGVAHHSSLLLGHGEWRLQAQTWR